MSSRLTPSCHFLTVHETKNPRKGVTDTDKRSVTFIRGLPEAVNLANVVELDSVLAEEPPVHDENLVVEQMRERERAEDFGEKLRHVVAVLGLDLAVEAVDLVHAAALVVAAGQVNACGGSKLVKVRRPKG